MINTEGEAAVATGKSKDFLNFANDIGIVGGAQILIAVTQFIRIPMLTKTLGTYNYGVWSLLWTTIVLLSPIAIMGLQWAFLRYIAAEKDANRIREAYWSVITVVLAMSVLMSAIMFLLADTFANFIIGDTSTLYLIRLASLMIPAEALSQLVVVCFSTFRQMKIYSILSGTKAVATVMLMLWFLLLGWDLAGIIIATIIIDAMCIIGAFVIIYKQIGFHIPKFDNLKTLLIFGIPLVPTSAILWLMQSSDKYFIGYLKNATDVGIYAAAYGIASVLAFFLNPLGVVLFPTISKSYDEGDIVRTQTYLRYSFKYLMLISIPCAFGIAILATPILTIFTTAEFAQGNTVMPFIAFGVLFYNLYQICSYIILLNKKSHWITIILITAAIVNIALNILLIPYVGITGAAIANMLSYACLGIFTMIIAFKYLRFNLSLSIILRSVLASIIMASLLWLLKPDNLISIILSICGCGILYFAMIVAFKCFEQNEFLLAKSAISQLSFKKRR